MVNFTVSDIFNTVRGVYMNDAAGASYTDQKLMPLIKLAYQSLQTELEKHSISCKIAKSEEIKVPAGTTILSLPGDFLIPEKLEERNWGSQDSFTEMKRALLAPNTVNPSSQLQYYDWRFNDQIHVPESNKDKGVVIYYQRSFPAIAQATDFVLGKSEQYLISKVAAYAHIFLAQNPTLAAPCNEEAKDNLDQILAIYIHKAQAAPARRRGYIPPYRY